MRESVCVGIGLAVWLSTVCIAYNHFILKVCALQIFHCNQLYVKDLSFTNNSFCVCMSACMLCVCGVCACVCACVLCVCVLCGVVWCSVVWVCC